MYFDGASNALGHGIRAILISPQEDYYPFTVKLDFNSTNNVAEYEACVMGLHAAIERSVPVLKAYRDLALVIYQLWKEWETHDSRLAQYKKLVFELLQEFKKVDFVHLPRDENQMANAFAILASMFKVNKNEKWSRFRWVYMSLLHIVACWNRSWWSLMVSQHQKISQRSSIPK